MPTSAWLYALVAACGYTVGSFPSGYLVSRALGIDIRQHGSGNIGATNILRVLGRKWGYLVFSLDALKGFMAVRLAFDMARAGSFGVGYPELIGIVSGFACILGHTFPIWLHFRGGKGVATSAGVLLGLMPIAVISVFLVWLLLFQLTKYVSVASIAAAVALPCFVALYLRIKVLTGSYLLLFSIVIAVIVLWRHRTNMHRLLRGKEQRFGER